MNGCTIRWTEDDIHSIHQLYFILCLRCWKSRSFWETRCDYILARANTRSPRRTPFVSSSGLHVDVDWLAGSKHKKADCNGLEVDLNPLVSNFRAALQIRSSETKQIFVERTSFVTWITPSWNERALARSRFEVLPRLWPLRAVQAAQPYPCAEALSEGPK